MCHHLAAPSGPSSNRHFAEKHPVPSELRYWITTGAAPAFVKFEGAMFLNGPRWRVELRAPRWAVER